MLDSSSFSILAGFDFGSRIAIRICSVLLFVHLYGVEKQVKKTTPRYSHLGTKRGRVRLEGSCGLTNRSRN
jgi:hypothetical protein